MESQKLISLEHPETMEVQGFSLIHAQNVLDRQRAKNLPSHQCWKLVDESYEILKGKITLKVKDVAITPKPSRSDSK